MRPVDIDVGLFVMLIMINGTSHSQHYIVNVNTNSSYYFMETEFDRIPVILRPTVSIKSIHIKIL